MKLASRILATLEERDLLHLANQVAAEHHVTLEQICAGGRASEVVAARHALWIRLRDEPGLGSLSAIARLFGVDHTAVFYAVQKEAIEAGPIVSVVLAVFDGPDEGYLLRWKKDPDKPFSITQRSRRETTFYGAYAVARARFDVLCERAGAPSFRSFARARDGGGGDHPEHHHDQGGAS